MIQIAICDDSEVTLQHLDQAVTTILQSNQEVADITLYSKSENLSYDIKEGHFFDLILTDIEMPHLNGMELAATIRTHLPGALIIFITAYTKYALDAFELSAFRYIDKEMIPEKLPTAIKDAFRILHMQADQYYLLSNTRMYRKLLLKDILYISREGKNSVFHLTNQTEVKERKSLNPVMEELNSSDFVFADRGIIVNLIHIVSIQDTTIELDNGEFLPTSLARIKELKLLLLFAVLLFEIDLRNRQHLLEKEALSKHLLEEKYQNLNEVYSQNARLYHDLNNHLIALDHLLDDGNISEAKTYIAAIQKPVQILKKTHWTGADVVDAVLNNKIQLLCNTDCFTISNVSKQLENIFSKTVDKSRHVMYIKEVRVAR